MKEILIEAANRTCTKPPPDSNMETQIRLPEDMEGPGRKTKWVKLMNRSVYPGTKYQDTAISKFRPNLEEHNDSNRGAD